jgi:hypothetical protein
MPTRRRLIQTIPAATAAFAVAGRWLGEASAQAQEATETATLADGHFHPKGKAPSEFTLEVLKKAKQILPFDDTL